MRIFFLITILIFIWSSSLFAQSSNSIKGVVVDSSRKEAISATIIVLSAKDSIIKSFTYSEKSGLFFIKHLNYGTYTLLVTYPEYADYVEYFSIDASQPNHDFGKINMGLKSKLLSEIIIKGEAYAIKIKGDTTQFNATSYVIQPNAKVEDLLKQLPGIQVDRNGRITAQGKSINKVLLDGEEFFGDDPTLITRNIRADMVDKVELYDKKSDQATFTGIDDGKKTKTINIKLKEDKKNGTFGKLEVGNGIGDYYQGQALYNRFKEKKRFSSYGTVANTGKVSLGSQDNSRLGTTENTDDDADEGIYIKKTALNNRQDYFSQSYLGNGLPFSTGAGVHYNDKLRADQESINADYKIGYIKVTSVNLSTIQQALPTGSLIINDKDVLNDDAYRQKVYTAYQLKINPNTEISVLLDASLKNFQSSNNYGSQTQNGKNLLNNSDRHIDDKGNQQLVNSSIFFNKKLKHNSALSWNVVESYNHDITYGYLNSNIRLFDSNGIQDSLQHIDQYKRNDITSLTFKSLMVYSRAISKYITGGINYDFIINQSLSNSKSFNRSSLTNYDLLDSVYSNEYKFNLIVNRVGISVNYSRNKSKINWSGSVSNINFDQIDKFKKTSFNRNFLVLSPKITYQYAISEQKSLSFDYKGYSTLPTIEQIQPVMVNIDPLNITIGNPILKPAFTNAINLKYNLFKPLSSFSVFIGADYSITANPVINNTFTDSLGKTIVSYANLIDENSRSYSLYSSLSRRIKSLDMRIGVDLNSTSSIGYSFINNALNKIENQNYSMKFFLEKLKQKLYDIYASVSPSYTVTKPSLLATINNNAKGFASNDAIFIFLPKKFQLTMELNYTYMGKTEYFTTVNRTILNTIVGKTFLKGDNLKLSLTVNDLFNSNQNINRFVYGNSVIQNNNQGVRRYFLLSIAWDFRKFKTSIIN